MNSSLFEHRLSKRSKASKDAVSMPILDSGFDKKPDVMESVIIIIGSFGESSDTKDKLVL